MMSMNEQLKEAFGQIRAEDQLKKKTKELYTFDAFETNASGKTGR